MNWVTAIIILIAAAALSYSFTSPSRYKTIFGIAGFLVLAGAGSYNLDRPNVTFWVVLANVAVMAAGMIIESIVHRYLDKPPWRAASD